jgi:tetraprenyl-beta-curcumene synthase
VIRPISPSGSLLRAFLPAAVRYWLTVFPAVRREVDGLRSQALRIPDPTLRTLALAALREERGNLEGAAAFAAFLPGTQRLRVVRALVAFQAAYDYADALSEQPTLQPMSNALRLHRALAAALSPCRLAGDYYSRSLAGDDGEYLTGLVERCASVVCGLPSYSAVAALTQAAARRIAIYQSLNLNESQGGRGALERWARARGGGHDEHSGLRWWEAAAAAGSSLVVFALIAAAASPGLEAGQARALANAYFPWIGALHTLLDSLADRSEDAQSGYRSFIDYYDSPAEAARRLQALACASLRMARTLPHGVRHSLILAAMVSFYVSSAEPRCPCARLARPLLLAAMGRLGRPSLLVMRARWRAGRIRRRRAARPRRRARRGRARDCGAAPRG